MHTFDYIIIFLFYYILHTIHKPFLTFVFCLSYIFPYALLMHIYIESLADTFIQATYK